MPGPKEQEALHGKGKKVVGIGLVRRPDILILPAVVGRNGRAWQARTAMDLCGGTHRKGNEHPQINGFDAWSAVHGTSEAVTEV